MKKKKSSLMVIVPLLVVLLLASIVLGSLYGFGKIKNDKTPTPKPIVVMSTIQNKLPADHTMVDDEIKFRFIYNIDGLNRYEFYSPVVSKEGNLKLADFNFFNDKINSELDNANLIGIYTNSSVYYCNSISKACYSLSYNIEPTPSLTMTSCVENKVASELKQIDVILYYRNVDNVKMANDCIPQVYDAKLKDKVVVSNTTTFNNKLEQSINVNFVINEEIKYKVIVPYYSVKKEISNIGHTSTDYLPMRVNISQILPVVLNQNLKIFGISQNLNCYLKDVDNDRFLSYHLSEVGLLSCNTYGFLPSGGYEGNTQGDFYVFYKTEEDLANETVTA